MAPRFTRLEHDERRAQILICARRLFSGHHYGEVSLADVAREAGVARGLLHHYFRTKRELYVEVVRSMVTPPADLLADERLPAGDRDLVLHHAVDLYLDSVRANRETWLATVGAQGFGRDAEVEAVLERAREATAARVIELVRPGARPSAELRGRDPRLRRAGGGGQRGLAAAGEAHAGAGARAAVRQPRGAGGRRGAGCGGDEEGGGGVTDKGLFGPDSITWRINRENVLVLGGGRALVLQVAHPLVGAGVAQHSNYRKDPWGRLFRTLDRTTAIVFGDEDDAEQASSAVWNLHGRVEGTSDAGTPYRARDPKLLMWVHATLVDTSLMVYDRYVARLSIAERERYYEEQKAMAEAFGCPRSEQPETYAEFNDYFATMVDEELEVTDVTRDVLDSINNPELPGGAVTRGLAWPLFEPIRMATAAMLPERLRRELGLTAGPLGTRMLGVHARLLRTALPLVPGLVREFPRAREAERRARAA